MGPVTSTTVIALAGFGTDEEELPVFPGIAFIPGYDPDWPGSYVPHWLYAKAADGTESLRLVSVMSGGRGATLGPDGMLYWYEANVAEISFPDYDTQARIMRVSPVEYGQPLPDPEVFLTYELLSSSPPKAAHMGWDSAGGFVLAVYHQSGGGYAPSDRVVTADAEGVITVRGLVRGVSDPAGVITHMFAATEAGGVLLSPGDLF